MTRVMMIKCRHCNGMGRHELEPTGAITLAAIDSEWRNTADLQRRLGGAKIVSPTALINRLVDLLGHGFVERRLSPVNHRRHEWRLDRANKGRIP